MNTVKLISKALQNKYPQLVIEKIGKGFRCSQRLFDENGDILFMDNDSEYAKDVVNELIKDCKTVLSLSTRAQRSPFFKA